MRPSDMTPLKTLAEKHPCGTRVRYMAGCKCLLCRAANSRYETDRAKARANGDWNGLVSADRARAHLEMLAKHGIGRYVVADAAGLNPRRVAEIRSGRKRNIRARNERAILSVTPEARGAKTLVAARPVWAQVNRLLKEGFTRTELARRLGSHAKVPALQLRPHVVTAQNAMRVEKLYATVMAGSGMNLRQKGVRSIPQRRQT